MTVREEEARFFGKLAALMEAGIPMLKAFEVGIERVGSPGLRDALERIVKRAYGGSSLTDAFGQEGDYFATEVLCLLSIGEEMGDLERKAGAIAKGLGDGVFQAGTEEISGAGAGPGLLDDLLDRASADGCREIHVEPGREAFRVRHRAGDGGLAVVDDLPAGRARALLHEACTRSGIHEGMNHGEFLRDDTLVEAVICPYEAGKGLVLTLSATSDWPATLEEAGLSADQASTVRTWLVSGRGLVAVTGPLASGHVRTLTALLREQGPERRKIVACGPPPGFFVPGVLRTDAAVKGSAELWERQRLDHIVLFGSLPAEALDAAEGCLVSSCFRARRAIDALLDLGARTGVDALSRVLTGVLCQRELPRADGAGTVPLFELLTADTKVSELLREGTAPVKLEAACESAGMVPMHETAERLAEEGVVDPAEVKRLFG